MLMKSRMLPHRIYKRKLTLLDNATAALGFWGLEKDLRKSDPQVFLGALVRVTIENVVGVGFMPLESGWNRRQRRAMIPKARCHR